MDPNDDAEVDWYVRTARPPESDQEHLRWLYVDQILRAAGVFTTHYVSERLGKYRGDQLVEDAFKRFFNPRGRLQGVNGLTAIAFGSDVTIDEFSRADANVRAPRGDGEAFLAWIDQQADGRAYVEWLKKLDADWSAGRASRDEARVLANIHGWSKAHLSAAVERFKAAKAYLEREAERRRKEDAADARRRARTDEPRVPQQPHPTRRKYGELPPEPEVVIKRRGS